MRRMGFGLQGMVPFGISSSQDDESLSGFEELAMPLFDSLYNFARWLARSSNDAEDLVQETYLKALRSFGSFQRGTNFRAWMFQILRNTFLSSVYKARNAHDRCDGFGGGFPCFACNFRDS
jgi:DNA-directed RNA polymerase specialized sigma24 family protein